MIHLKMKLILLCKNCHLIQSLLPTRIPKKFDFVTVFYKLLKKVAPYRTTLGVIVFGVRLAEAW